MKGNPIDKQLASIKKKRLIFTVTTGRSGTGFLSKFCSNFDDVYSGHEEEPSFTPLMRKGKLDSNIYSDFWIDTKMPSILEKNENTYIESSHLVCKGYFEFLLENDVNFDIINLKREKMEVAKSYFFLNVIPARTSGGLKYLLHPEDSDSLTTIRDWNTLTDFQLCLWYCSEIEHKMKHYEERVRSKGNRVLNLSFRDLTSGVKLSHFYDFMNVKRSVMNQLKDFFSSMIRNNAKTKLKIKKKVISKVDFDKEYLDFFNLYPELK
ncbi:MAG: hypothetical protein COA58_01625 [Bacteroidetes bacterium]|nr:MAG: hypothetical protein COA58_01625 [Bacteroidota bacterium]